jgi:hypothetical protein
MSMVRVIPVRPSRNPKVAEKGWLGVYSGRCYGTAMSEQRAEEPGVQKPSRAVANIRDEIKRIVKRSDKQPATNDYERGFFDGQLSALRWAMAE